PARSATGPALGRECAQKEALARAVEDEHLARGIDWPRQLEAAAEPLGGGGAELVEPLVHGIAAELGQMGGEHWANERGHRVLRLADREADCGHAGWEVGQKLAQPHERRAARGRAGRRGRRY